MLSQEVIELIEQTADSAATKAATRVSTAYSAGTFSYYRAMEALLFNYMTLAELVADKMGYMEPSTQSRSKDIVRYSPHAGGPREDDPLEMAAELRRTSYEKTKARFDEIDHVIHLFKDRREFIVISMYYFNLDYNGDKRAAQRYTWEEIADELDERGIISDRKSVRRWRNKIVNDMAVVLFGLDAAVAGAMYRT